MRELFPRLTGGIRWGLARTRRMLGTAGDPHLSYHTLHVGGTNGKGSVAATLASVLRAAGWRTGLYTSPHLCAFRERIQVDGIPIGESDLVEAAEVMWPAVESENPSFFEATTAIGFLALARAGVDIAVVEVGLGGRLDATNVVEPAAVVLTNVALDHVQLLGPTLAHVAREKAGIIKAGVPVVTGETGQALAVFRRRAAEVGAPLQVLREAELSDVRTDLDGTELRLVTDAWGELSLHTPLPGRHQAVNAALAVRALERLPASLRPPVEALRLGMAAVHWPGRLQIERVGGRTWVFDVAHNVAGVQALGEALRELRLPRPIVSLVAVLGDKDWRGMLGPLYDASDAVILTLAPTAPQDRRWDPDAVRHEVPAPHVESVPDFVAALKRASAIGGRDGEGTVVVTGSFHTVGDTLSALGLAPFGADSDLPVPIVAA